MDDAKTHQALDAIADLFLTRPAAPLAPVAAVRGVRLSPKPGQQGRALSSFVKPSDQDQYIPSYASDACPAGTYAPPSGSALSSLPAASKPAISPDASPGVVSVEAVFLASLPGLSGPWLTQYANYLLDHHPAVGLIRLDDQQFEVQRVSRHPASAVTASPTLRLVEHQPINDIERQLFSAGDVGTVLVQPVDAKAPDAIAQIMAAGRWTILCGAYEAAVKDAQRIIGQLLELGPIPHRHRLGLMMMGCDAAKARQAVDAINRGLAGLLTGPIEMVGHQMQMVPVNVRTLGVWEANGENLSLLLDYLSSSSPAFANQSQTLSPVAAAAVAATSWPSRPIDEPVADETESLQEAAAVATIIPAGALPSPSPSSPMPAHSSARQREYRQAFAAQPPIPAKRPETPLPPAATLAEPMDSPSQTPVQLSSHLDQSLPGAIVLQARCPKHPAVEILLDQQGKLHLLASAVQAADPAGLRSVVVDLLESRRWLAEHIDLIRLTQRQCRFDDAAPVELHLFTDQAPLAAGLATSLSDQLRVHLLQTVTLNHQGQKQTATLCTNLN